MTYCETVRDWQSSRKTGPASDGGGTAVPSKKLPGREIGNRQMSNSDRTGPQKSVTKQANRPVLKRQLSNHETSDQERPGVLGSNKDPLGERTSRSVCDDITGPNSLTEDSLPSICDEQSSDRQLSDRPASDWQLSDRQLSDRQLSDRQLSDRQLSNRQPSDLQESREKQMSDCSDAERGRHEVPTGRQSDDCAALNRQLSGQEMSNRQKSKRSFLRLDSTGEKMSLSVGGCAGATSVVTSSSNLTDQGMRWFTF